MIKTLLFKTVTKVALLLGSWPLRFFAWWISTGYFFFRPSRRKLSIQLYQAIFPERKGWYHLYCAWRQFHSFAATYGDRMDFESRKEVFTSTQGREGILEANKRGTGGIILMSHLGSYEVAASGFQKYGLKLLLIMGEKEARLVARDQRQALKDRGISIQVATGQGDSLMGGLEAIKFIREGGFVSLAGDLIWTEQRSFLTVKFFGREVVLASGPYLLALVSGAPLFILFTFRVKRGRHQVIVLPPRQVTASIRSERDKVLQESAQAYAEALEEMVRRHPFQWYIFEPFFQPLPAKLGNSSIGLKGQI
ncbi:MAG: lysophospholipid acyltransferase family protein [Thermodesulfobacteriota bacterium]|jgi:predicted LPLAT superfamily acyltransferase